LLLSRCIQIKRNGRRRTAESGCRGWFDGNRRKRNPELFNHLETSAPDELRHHGRIEPRGIVLDSDGMRALVEGQPPDSVYLAGVGQGEAHRFCGRRGVAENNVDVRHRHRIAVWR
jgi:hypothetical protein